MATWGRRLRKNDDVTIPGTVICVAVATVSEPDAINPRNQIHRLRCGAAIAGRMEDGKWTREKSVKFTDAVTFWEWANCRRQSGKPCWIFCHDASKFLTLTGLLSALSSSEFSLSRSPATSSANIARLKSGKRPKPPQPGLMIDADPPTAIVCFHRSGWRLTILDLRNYWDKTLPQLSRLVSRLPPATVPSAAPLDEHEVACQCAAETIRDCVVRLCCWHKSQAMGVFGMTVASMALSGFRHRWMQHAIEVTALQSDRDFERRAYFNGRTEPLWIGRVASGVYIPPPGVPHERQFFGACPCGPFHLVDARSFYGAVGTFQSLPVRCVEEGDGWPDADGISEPLGGDYLAEIALDSQDFEFPIRFGTSVRFARGRFTTVLCGPELQRAVDSGAVVSVGHWRRYELEPIFRGYAVGLWMEREAAEGRGDLLTAALIKGLLARLHGKFLQRDHRWQIMPGLEAPGPWRKWHVCDKETGERRNYRSVGMTVQLERPAGDKPHTFPAVAAWVTAWGREYLRSWQNIAGAGHVFYLSTDGLIVDDVGRQNLERAGIIGDYGIGSCRVTESSNEMAVYAANHFSIGNKVALAGVPETCIDRKGDFVRYYTTASLAQKIVHVPDSTYTAFEQRAFLDRSREHQRLTAGGWLKPVILNEGSLSWRNCEFVTHPSAE